ncbi:hypothetical protein IMCC20628_02655 [Hoeflea sp. IMCC20628]|uniref:hypothetical protein n=1 Tax=Hoeflea sp. IMCC20628 TaxID=1620421 RepID=UPI00063BD5E1|nr:hypothetical protein [Hoeflea sp. IMCC20628]AKI01352.1 hypothetical protein IMCC20628_02655 [Hoeflea sp. IMCC20628]
MPSQHAAATSSSNYLTRMALDQQERKWPRRDCSVLFNIFFMRKGVRQISKAQLRVFNISEGGLLATSRRTDIPDNFYISIGDKQMLIACAIVGRQDGMLNIRFLHDLPTVFIDVVASLQDPFALLE